MNRNQKNVEMKEDKVIIPKELKDLDPQQFIDFIYGKDTVIIPLAPIPGERWQVRRIPDPNTGIVGPALLASTGAHLVHPNGSPVFLAHAGILKIYEYPNQFITVSLHQVRIWDKPILLNTEPQLKNSHDLFVIKNYEKEIYFNPLLHEKAEEALFIAKCKLSPEESKGATFDILRLNLITGERQPILRFVPESGLFNIYFAGTFYPDNFIFYNPVCDMIFFFKFDFNKNQMKFSHSFHVQNLESLYMLPGGNLWCVKKENEQIQIYKLSEFQATLTLLYAGPNHINDLVAFCKGEWKKEPNELIRQIQSVLEARPIGMARDTIGIIQQYALSDCPTFFTSALDTKALRLRVFDEDKVLGRNPKESELLEQLGALCQEIKDPGLNAELNNFYKNINEQNTKSYEELSTDLIKKLKSPELSQSNRVEMNIIVKLMKKFEKLDKSFNTYFIPQVR